MIFQKQINFLLLSMNFSITTIKLLVKSFWIIKILLWWDISKHQIHFCVGVVKHCNCSVNGDSKQATAICKVNYFKVWVQYMVSEMVKAHFNIEIPQLQSEFPKSIGSRNWSIGLGNYTVCNRFTVQTFLRSLLFVIHNNSLVVLYGLVG